MFTVLFLLGLVERVVRLVESIQFYQHQHTHSGDSVPVLILPVSFRGKVGLHSSWWEGDVTMDLV